MESAVRILLVEDEPMWQEGIRALLSTVPGLELVAVAEDYDQALQAFQSQKPNLVLLDWNLKGDRTGLDVGRALEEFHGFSASRIVLVSGNDPSVIPPHAYSAVPKHQIAIKLVDMIQRVTKN
jgi:DNA-binding NarL/FixJ family response regulator